MSLEERIKSALQIAGEDPRRFVVSVSGGLDSTVLLHLLHRLRRQSNISVFAFHMNFQLRGKASMDDEAFVKKLCKRLKISLTVKRVKIEGDTAIQEQARKLRLLAVSQICHATDELVEAHHFDDQLETFFFRLFRGSGLRGLSVMKESSMRGGVRVRRPLLRTSKAELHAFAKAEKIQFREDASNKSTDYDRNILRLEILPMIQRRFPQMRESISKMIDQIQSEEDRWIPILEKAVDEIVLQHPQIRWDWSKIQNRPPSEVARFVQYFFSTKLQTQLSHEKTLELVSVLKGGVSFSFNGPKNIIVKGRQRSRSVAVSGVHFYRASKSELVPLEG